MTRIGIYQGDFSPPHKGHVSAARAFMEQMWLDFLYVIPTPAPNCLSSVGDAARLRMCALAFSDLEGVYVSDVRMRRTSLETVDLLRELCGEDRRLFLLVGGDEMLSLGGRKDADEIFRLSYPAYVRREKDAALDARFVNAVTQYQNDYGKVVRRIVTPPVEISSTEVRERCKNGRPISELVPPLVESYIHDNHLYV